MIELTEVMRQKNDKPFTELLNRIRTASHTEDDIKVIQSRCIVPGQMGTVIKIGINTNNEPHVLYVKFDDEKAGKTTINTSSNSFAKENRFVPIEPVLAKIKVRPGKASSPEIQRIQFPIALSWACTFHKVQGLTLKNVVVSLD